MVYVIDLDLGGACQTTVCRYYYSFSDFPKKHCANFNKIVMFIISTKQHLECTQHFQMKIVQKLSRGTGFLYF